MTSRSTHPLPPSATLSDLLEEWVAAGLISDDQSRSIRQHEARPHARGALTGAPTPTAPAERGPSLVVEALSYLGGVVMLVGAFLLVGTYWNDLSVAVRLVLVGLTAVALIGAGWAVPDSLGDAAGRLRSVLWALGVAATAGFLGVLSTEVFHRYDEHALVVIGPVTALVAGILWWLRPTVLQQLALFVPLLVAAVGAGMELTSTDSWVGGATMWLVALVFAGLSWAGRLEPRLTGVAFGLLGAVLGTMIMANDAGIALGLLTAVATVALALGERNLVWLGTGALATLWTTPRAALQWFPGQLSAALTLLVTGGLLVASAIWLARHRTEERHPAR